MSTVVIISFLNVIRAVEIALQKRECALFLYGCRVLLKLMLFSTITAIVYSVSPVISIPEHFINPNLNLIKHTNELPNLDIAINYISPEPPKEKKIVCIGCSDNESSTLDFFQKNGIKDKNALAVIMGNIKQESNFIPNICEGGSVRRYESCGAGFGILQFTSSDRYFGLGSYARSIGKSPSVLSTQLSYILTEPQWKTIESRIKIPGKSIEQYMGYAYSWIGWGIHGARTKFAYDYSKRFIEIDA